MMLRRAIEALILVGTASLVYWPAVHRGTTIIPFRAELPFAIALALGVAEMVVRPRRGLEEPLLADPEARWTCIALGVLLGACVLATGLSWFRYHLAFNALGRETMLKLILNMLIFALIYRALRVNERLFEKVALALFLSTLVPLGLGLSIIIDPHVHEFLTGALRLPPLVFGGERFQGLTSNPVMMTFNALTGTAFFLTLAFYELRPRRLRAWGLASVVGGMGLLILWSQSRAALIALACLVAMAVIAGVLVLRRGIGRRGLLIALIALVMIAGWRLVPTIVATPASGVHPQDLLTERLVGEGADPGGRLTIYRYYAHLIPSNPLGVGFNYEQIFVADLTYQHRVAAHSSFFELWMFGGVGAVLAAAAVFVIAGVRAVRGLRAMAGRGEPGKVADLSYLAAAIAFVSYWIEMTFIGSPFNETINFVLLAMILSGAPRGAAQEDGMPVSALSGPLSWFGYGIMLVLGLLTARGGWKRFVLFLALAIVLFFYEEIVVLGRRALFRRTG